jgi:hypothetical protein
MLMAESAESNLLTLVKPRSTCFITSKTEPTTLSDPLDKVNTPWWSIMGQRHGQTLLKSWRRWMSFRTFAAFSKFHLNTSKSTKLEVVQFVEEHNFHLDWHFKISVEISKKHSQPPSAPVHRDIRKFKVWLQFTQNPLRKAPYGLWKSWEYSEIYNFPIHHLVHFY